MASTTTTATEIAHLRIPLQDIVRATNCFHRDNFIGQGGLGVAYKGRLSRSGEGNNGKKITALRLHHKQGKDIEFRKDIEFWTEISVLSDLKHTNLVSIIGFCDEENEKIIVFTRAAKGSLKGHLDSSSLTWTQRLRICVGIARALSYLHHDEGRGYGVIHRNINSTTVLLDENWEAKLSGFKVSILQSSIRMIDHVVLSEPVGTIGYMDPETEKTGGVTHKSDIYAFGVVLYEMVCGRRAYIESEANTFLTQLVKHHHEKGTMLDIVLPSVFNQLSPYSLLTYLKVAYSCLEEEQVHRPDASRIVEELDKALKFQLRLENLGSKLEHLKTPLNDIKLATNNFSAKCGFDFSDANIECYVGEIGHFDKEESSSEEMKSEDALPKRHNTVYIKRFRSTGGERGDELFSTELEMLTSVKHHNTVTLIGFCAEGFEIILVTESFSNGYLSRYLGNVKEMSTLTWEKRLKICIDVAHALRYLHFEMDGKQVIIHGCINNRCIGLDENLGAKIDEFQSGAFMPTNEEDKTPHKKSISYLKYYVDPEYLKDFVNTGRLKREADVYSFGVVLFEILCGKKVDDPIYLNESDKGLVFVAKRSFCTGTLNRIVDPILKGETNENISTLDSRPYKDSFDTFCKIAYQCVAETQDKRPSMKVVARELEKSFSLLFQEERIQHSSMDQFETNEERMQHSSMDQLENKFQLASATQIEKFKHLKIPLRDIEVATEKFSHKYIIATRDACTMYRAKLDNFGKENPSSEESEDPKGQKSVIITRYSTLYGAYGEEEFFTEIEMLTVVEHDNIVTLLGFCFEASEMILVTEDLSYGYLGDYLQNVEDRRLLTWEIRLNISVAVACALNYLHYEIEDQKVIINRRISSLNIGLDEKQGAKIFGFGFSIFLPPNQNDEALYTTTGVGGMQAYIDPEYKKTCRLKRESDVYSFGVLLFEILCGRKASDPIYNTGADGWLAHAARQSYRAGTLENMIDPIIKEETGENSFILNKGPNKDSLHTYIEIAYKCVAETQDKRPTMKVVLEELEKALYIQEADKDKLRISLEDIKLATQNFKVRVGEGGFGNVYKGTLKGETIVAKRLDTRYGQGEQQFLSELQILWEYKHENIIGLAGYCDENDEKIIVYEYASGGSLNNYLNDARLTWIKRLNICIDVARALDFLHGGDGKQAKVIHKDIKTANILLNTEWKAKLGDFGLSLISPITKETKYVIDNVSGTDGYIDPLYKKSGFLTIESDIYSFGVVLLEILYGKLMYHDIHKHEMVFEQIQKQIEKKSLTTFKNIAYQCLHDERQKRPTTKKVLAELEKALEIQNMASTMIKFTPIQIPLKEVVKATNNFHVDNIITHGIFGTTYEGRLLWSGKETKIAARRFDCKHGEVDFKFLREISVLYDLKHTNLVSIVAFCDEEDEKIIITKYEANGSLRQYLNSLNLTWTQRLRICVGLAHALSYLSYEKGRDYAIIHCNINSDTILLDENWEAKLSSFEDSIKQSVYNKDYVCHCEHIGTMGYMDPTIENTGGVTQKSDIYSFGVVLFEMLCGRKACIQNEYKSFLAPLAKYHYEKGTLQEIIHLDRQRNQISQTSLDKYSNVAYSCLKDDRADRPNIGYIVHELEKALEFQLRRESIEKKFEHLKIPLSAIKLATDNFSDTYKIASWNEYTLYRAELDCFDKENPLVEEKKTVIIKKYPSKHRKSEIWFYTEIEMLSGVKHPNIVTLLGLCVEGFEMILVTENVSNGCLHDYLENIIDKRILTWEKRLKICVDVAHALKYLHFEMEDQKAIIHRDIHSRSIALSESWGAKIVDFGDSVFLPPNQEGEALYLDWVGREAYIDPEYKKTDKLKRESDVYSFGVVLLEILCGGVAYDPIYDEKGDIGLASKARRRFHEGTLEDMIDPTIKEVTDENSFVLNRGPNVDSLHTFMKIANQCVAETQDQRPTMKVVVKELEKALFFQVDGRASQKQGIYSLEEKSADQKDTLG